MGFPPKKNVEISGSIDYFGWRHPKAFDRHQVTVLPGRVSGAWTFATDQSRISHGDHWVTP